MQLVPESITPVSKWAIPDTTIERALDMSLVGLIIVMTIAIVVVVVKIAKR